MKAFIKALPLVAQSLSEEYSIKVTVGGKNAYATGDSINLPCISEEDESLVPLMRGYLDHEVAHNRHTDLNVHKPAGMLGALLNIIEDIRIEIEMGREFPGSRINLRELDEELVARAESGEGYQLPEAAKSPAAAVALYVMYAGRSQILGHACMYDFARRAADKVRAELSHKIVNEIGQCVQEIAGLRNTADAKAMAERILQIVRDALEDQQQQQLAAQQQPQDPSESEDSADGGNSEASDANAEGGDDQIEGESPSDDQKADGTEAESQGVEGEPREGESQRGDSNPDSADSEDPECADESEGGDDQIEGESPSDDQKADGTEAESQGGVGNPSEGASQSGDSTPDGPGAEGSDGEDAQGHAECDATQSSSESGNADAMIQALRAVLDATEDDLPKDIGEVVAQLLNDAAAEYVDDGSMVVAAVEHDPLFTAKPVNPASVALATAGLRQRFLRLLQSKRMKRTKPRRHGADLDTTMLHRIALNDPRVFVNRQRKDGVNTSVLVLLDQSESMLRGNRARVATESALAIAMALEMIPGVKVAVAGFTQEEDYRPIVHKVMGFGQRVAHVLDKFVPVAQMYTPMAEALWWGIHQILQTREERKIIFTITDGEPDSAVAVKAALETMEGLGIEAVGLGIELDAVKSLFPVADSIRNLSELPSAVFRMLEDKLLDAA